MLGLVTAALLPLSAAGGEPTSAITVSAAMSLKPVMESVKPLFEKAHPEIVLRFQFGSSGALQQQILHGAPVDVFISAAARQMDELTKAGLVVEGTRFVLAGNTLVLVAPRASKIPVDFAGLARPEIRRIAVGEPRSVPAGQYAAEVFDHLGLRAAVQEKLVLAKDVRQVLVYVGTGNVDAGLVYGSDVRTGDGVRMVATAPPRSHRRIEYPAAMLTTAKDPRAARVFLDYLRTPAVAAVFREAGFLIGSDLP